MARTREFDPAELLQTAIQVFWEKGYADASVDEIVARSGVAKYGIYGVFGNKRELFFKSLEQFAQDRRGDIQVPLLRPNAGLAEIREFFQRTLDLLLDKSCPTGCLVNNTGIELGARDPEAKDFVKGFFRDLDRVMKRCLGRAVQSGDLDKSTDLGALARYLVNEFRLVLMLARNGQSRRELDSHLDFALEVLA